MISSSQRLLPDSTQLSQETDIHSPGGIRTRNPADPRLRWRGCRNWKASRLTFSTPYLAENTSPSNVKVERLRVLTTLFMKAQVFWDVTACWLVERRSERVKCLRLGCRGIYDLLSSLRRLYICAERVEFDLQMKVLRSFETSVTIYKSSRSKIPENVNPQVKGSVKYLICLSSLWPKEFQEHSFIL